MHPTPGRTTLATLGVATLALWAPLAAQQSGLREVREWGTSGASLALAIPTGYMGEFVDVAGGLDGFLAVNLGPGSPLALRFEGAFLVHQLSYGGTAFVVGGGPYTGPYGSVAVQASSGSYITSLRAGPQLTLGGDGMQLYGVLLGGEYKGIRFAYLDTVRDLGVVTEIFSGAPGADQPPDATYTG